MRFSYEESELINNFFENLQDVPTKENVIGVLEQAILNTTEPELIEIANNTIQKIKALDNDTLTKVLTDLPIDTYTTY